MRDYKKILLCLDLTDESERIAERAKALAITFGAELTLLHVVEYVPVEPMGEALLPAVQIEGELVERATSRLAELARKLDLGQAERLVLTGNIKSEVVRLAQERGADLILIGVSRSGKTPTCLYMAIHYGVKAANYPLTPDDLDGEGLPKALLPHRKKLFGLTIDPARLHQIRHQGKRDLYL